MEIESLVPDPIVAREFGVTLMSLWRWDQSQEKRKLGWPPKVQISGRNYRSRTQLEAFKQNLLRRALAARDGEAA